MIKLGSGLTFQELIDHPEIPLILKQACLKETTYNLRQMSTLGGCAAAGGGRSILLAVLLALNVQLEIQPGNTTIALGEVLPVRKQFMPQKLITSITINSLARATYETVSKTPGDRPIAGVAMAQWPNGRTRVCSFGFGDHPVTAMDGPSAVGAEVAARNAFAVSGDNHASTSYREEIAEVLAKRCLENLSGEAK